MKPIFVSAQNRRRPASMACALALLILGLAAAGPAPAQEPAAPEAFRAPPREFSVLPFWFWNDTLKDEELLRQMADFEAHGVFGFVIHPRIGLPQDTGWMSPRMIQAMRLVIEEAARRKMTVVLYDEGMYPSGSAGGQVAAKNPAHAARGLAKQDLAPGESPRLEAGWKLVTVLDRPEGRRVAIVERPSGGVIRGLHYLNEGAARLREFTPPAGDILNPDAVSSYLELVHERFFKEFGPHFGKTIAGVFTDEPSPMGRSSAKGMHPGNAALLAQIQRVLGYDFAPFLADLWYSDTPDSARHRTDYHRAVNTCLEENYYRRLGAWCQNHGVALMGHPGGSMDLGAERYFQTPGQDLVWRYVEPGPKALEGEHSTMAKCASSAMVHLGRRRNGNELYGAYGHNLTFDEMQWLANWCFVRGHNLLYPHAFYYSVRGPRLHERPPDVGPHAAWWDQYRPYADACRRLCWVNTDSRQICDLAILADAAWLPDKAAKVCFQHQRDFNYLETRHLWEDAITTTEGVQLAGMRYKAVVLDGLKQIPPHALPALQTLAKAGRLIVWGRPQSAEALKDARFAGTPEALTAAIDALSPRDIQLDPPSENIRARHVIKDGLHYYLLFNEESTPVTARLTPAPPGRGQWLDPATAAATPFDRAKPVSFAPHEFKLLTVPTAP